MECEEVEINMESLIQRLVAKRNKTLEKLKEYENPKKTKWTPVPCDNEDRQHVSLYEGETKKGKYLLKAETTLKGCTSKQILMLNIDNCYNTRKQWETEELVGIEAIQTLHEESKKGKGFRREPIKIIRYWIHIGWGIWDREFLGIQWYRYNKKSKQYTLVFKSANHPMFPCDKTKYQLGSAMTIMRIRQISDDEVAVRVFTHVNPKGYIPAWLIPLWNEKLRDRMLLYEKVAKEKYHKIYPDWVCKKEGCGKKWGPHEDKCRSCKTKRDEPIWDE